VQRFSLSHEWDHHKLPESTIDFHGSSSYRHCWVLSPCAAQVIFSNRYVVNMDIAECILLGDQLSVFEWQSLTVHVRWSSVAGKVFPKGQAIVLRKHVPYSGHGSSPQMFNAGFSCCQNVQSQSIFFSSGWRRWRMPRQGHQACPFIGQSHCRKYGTIANL